MKKRRIFIFPLIFRYGVVFWQHRNIIKQVLSLVPNPLEPSPVFFILGLIQYTLQVINLWFVAQTMNNYALNSRYYEKYQHNIEQVFFMRQQHLI